MEFLTLNIWTGQNWARYLNYFVSLRIYPYLLVRYPEFALTIMTWFPHVLVLTDSRHLLYDQNVVRQVKHLVHLTLVFYLKWENIEGIIHSVCRQNFPQKLIFLIPWYAQDAQVRACIRGWGVGVEGGVKSVSFSEHCAYALNEWSRAERCVYYADKYLLWGFFVKIQNGF